MGLSHITNTTFFLIMLSSVTYVLSHTVKVHFPAKNEGPAKIYEFKTDNSLSRTKKKLSNHGIQAFYTKYQAVQCGMECLKVEKCKSFNFHATDRYCQLNDATHEDFPGDLTDNDIGDYYLREYFSIDPVSDSVRLYLGEITPKRIRRHISTCEFTPS